MKLYSLIYIGGDQPATPEEGKAHFAKYQQWLASLGDAAVEPMVPFKNTQTLAPDRSIPKVAVKVTPMVTSTLKKIGWVETSVSKSIKGTEPV